MEKKCSTCGSLFKIEQDSSVRLPAKLSDDIHCDVCGAVLHSYNSTSLYEATLIKAEPWPK